ncbi:MAG: tetratricopeptide repeat protein, partial [Candidatus Moranbacteria bacterium]|nr:tetratricopeptide repeat protein [Candidatus Moranbacteria bacterium]
MRNLAGLYGKVRDFKNSYETFKKAQEIHPDSIEVKYGIAQTQEYMDEKEKAMEMYEEILSEERVPEPIRKQAQEQLDGLKREQKRT